MKNFKKLKIWQKGMEIVFRTYQLAKQLPSVEKYGLTIQITKAAVSIPSNIAEGSAKTSKKDYKNYLETSLGSAYELETQVLIIEMLGYGDKDIVSNLLKDVDEEQKMIHSFIKTVGDS
ncbi:four helix bundle protein [Fulvivirgaceae bacterium PWU4]|uniref:Four helix bundle protein n=1 Tax=Chryseosolibacter histidini TaxID=2782349 RepID=A0AAP2DNN5_9BACT|nr:four helix bundle protein [Chryseosolibacter histidini]MBT1698202.1 four helix bundle protein [Chryseosolibacter histidini]